MVQTAQSFTCTGLAMEGGVFLVIVHKAIQRQSDAVVFLADGICCLLTCLRTAIIKCFYFFFLSLLLVHGFPEAACFKQEPDCTRG